MTAPRYLRATISRREMTELGAELTGQVQGDEIQARVGGTVCEWGRYGGVILWLSREDLGALLFPAEEEEEARAAR